MSMISRIIAAHHRQAAAAGPWLTGWGYRVTVTPSATYAGYGLTDFPLYVDLSDMPAGFWSHVKNGGGDIRVCKTGTTTEVPREVVSCDTGTDTGELHFLDDGTASAFDIYYGNASANDYAIDATYGAENVWNSGFRAVYHDAGDVDSTSNDMDSTAGNVTAGNDAGVVGSATDYSGSSTYRALPTNVLAGSSDLTISAFAKYEGTDGAIISSYDTGITDGHVVLWFDETAGLSPTNETDTLSFLMESGGYVSSSLWANGPSSSFTSGQWYHVAVVHDMGSDVTLFKNGASMTNAYEQYITVTESRPSTDTYIGRSIDGAHDHTDIIDELRISFVTRSADWIAAEYANLSDPDTFWTIGSEEWG